METYTPTPVEMTNISLPQAGVDPVGVSTVRTALQAEADGIAFLNERATALLAALRTGQATISIDNQAGSPYLVDEWYKLDLDIGTTAPRTPVTVVAASVGDGDYIQLGAGADPVLGWWLLSISASVTDATITSATLNVYLHTGTDPTAGTIVASWRGATPDGSDISRLSDNYLFQVTSASPAPKLSFRVVTPQPHSFGTDPLSRRIYLTQVSRDF